MLINLLNSKIMENKKVIIITATSIIVMGILYLAFKKASTKDVLSDPKLKADFDAVIQRIDNAKT